MIEDSLEPLDPVISAEAEAAPRKGYWRVTSSGTYGFLAALPLFILYEGFILLVNTDPAAQVRVGADLWTKQLLAAIGGTGLFALGIPVLLIGVFIFIRERKLKLPFRSDWFGWMIGESALYTVVVALLVSTVVGAHFFRGTGSEYQPIDCSCSRWSGVAFDVFDVCAFDWCWTV